jgi:Domain of Unknown Function with PDB structure (DUF3857)
MSSASRSKNVVRETCRLSGGRFSLVGALLFLLFCHTGFAETKANIPDWVRQAAAQKLPAYPSDTNAVVLLREETDTVTAPDEHIEHFREVTKILRPDGRDFGNLVVRIGKDEKLIALHGWSFDVSAHEYELKAKDFLDRSFTGFELYSDIMFKHAMAPGASPGAIVAWEYEVRRRDYFNELHWPLQQRIPVLHTAFTVQLPTGWELKESWSGTDPAKPTASSGNGWTWTKDNLPGIEDESARPVDAAIAARMSVGLYTSSDKLGTDWTALARWASALFRVRQSVTPDMSAKVQELTGGKGDFDTKVRVLTEFMQREVRYVEIQIGIGGYQPHPASDVFHARYGDCKDKANLLLTLLAQAGIGSEMVLIHTDRGVVRPETPGNYFDHAILAIELPSDVAVDKYSSVIMAKKSAKHYVLFDPTDEWMPFGQLRSELQDSYALLVTESGGELIHVPIAPPDNTQLVRSANLKLSAEGAIAGEVHEQLTGDFAEELRMGARSVNRQQQLQHYERQVTYSVKNAMLKDLQFDGLQELTRPVKVEYSLNADRYAQIMGSLLIVRPRVLGVTAISLDRKPRKYPLVVGTSACEKDDFEVEIPAGYALDDKPEGISLDTPFASYKSTIEVNGTKLHYSREYTMKSLEIPADKIEDLRAFENKIAADENAAVVFKKVTQPAGQD